jgi:nucleoside-diphosphate-sugar epimerase
VNALVTGAGGFVGGAVARALRARGNEVLGFSRAAHPELSALGVDQQQGDVADSSAVMDAVRGVDVVFHTAAKVAASGRYADFHATNVRGTDNVVAACRECGVAALVYTSTPSVTFGLADLEGVDESIGYSDHYDADYSRTKAEAERLLLAAASDDLRTVALRPHLVWGPGDTSLLPRVVQRGRSGVLRRIDGPTKRTDVAYIDDAVQAHLLAAERLLAGGEAAARVSGNAYFISSGEPVEIWEFIDRLLAAAGVAAVEKRVSLRAALAAGWVFEKTHALTGALGEPRLSRWIVRELTTARWFDISAARRDLGYEPRVSLDDGMRRLAAWIEEQGG